MLLGASPDMRGTPDIWIGCVHPDRLLTYPDMSFPIQMRRSYPQAASDKQGRGPTPRTWATTAFATNSPHPAQWHNASHPTLSASNAERPGHHGGTPASPTSSM